MDVDLPRRRLLRWGAGSAVGVGTAALVGTAADTAAGSPACGSTAAADPPVRRSALLRIAADGSIAWQTPVPLGQDEQGSAVVAARGRLFLAQGDALRSFDVASGKPGWVRTVSGVPGQLIALDGLVLLVLSSLSGRDQRIAAYDHETGRPRWTHDSAADFIVLYRLRSGSVLAQQRYQTVALNTATGRVRWSAPVPGHDDGGSEFAQLATSPSTVVQAGVLTTAGLDAGTGRRLWSRALPIGAAYPVLTGSVAVLAPEDFGGSAPGGVVAVDARTGAHRWTVTSADESGSVVAAGFGVVVAMTGGTVQGGRTTAVSAESGRVLWSAPIPAASGTEQPSAMTARSVAYLEDLWHDAPGHQHRTISLVNRRLHDGRVRYRHPISDPTAQGTPPQLHGRFLPLVLDPGGRGPVAIGLFDLATHRVRFTRRIPHWPTASPLPLSDGSVVSLTADPQTGVAL